MSMDTLSPRGLLAKNKTFCYDGPNFSKLQDATQATLTLPYDDSRLQYYVRFTARGQQELYADLLVPVMEYFYQIANQSMDLESGFRGIENTCTSILELSAKAKDDYDEIFVGLKRLYGDESDNESLRAEIQEKIKQRLDVVNGMSGNAKDTSDNLVVAIRNINDAQEWAKKVGVDLAKQTTVDRLRRCHEGEIDAQEEFESDVLALERLKGIIAKQNMQDDSSASLVDLQLAVGAAFDIVGDLAALTEYITNNTEPGPGPLLNLEKNELLEMWSDLAIEVQKFKDNFIGAEGAWQVWSVNGILFGET